MTIFVTSNRYKRSEVAALLQGLEIEWRRLDLPPSQGSLSERVRLRASAAWQVLGARCFTELAELAAGNDSFSGAEFKRRIEKDGPSFFESRAGQAKVSIAVALAETDGSIEVFEGQVCGVLLSHPQGDGGYGWDAHFIPEGASRSLANLNEQKAWLNARSGPYLQLASRLRGEEFEGVFEAHITVDVSGDELVRFTGLCETHGVKPIVIELARGETRVQPMSGSYHQGPLSSVQLEVFALARQFANAQFDVTRVKIEATGANRDLPQSDADAQRAPARYFEFHVKVSLGPSDSLSALREQCEAHDAHLSRNARHRDGTQRVHFVTLRVAKRGQPNAEESFRQLRAALTRAGYPLSHALIEYTVYDSNLSVDRGWLSNG